MGKKRLWSAVPASIIYKKKYIIPDAPRIPDAVDLSQDDDRHISQTIDSRSDQDYNHQGGFEFDAETSTTIESGDKLTLHESTMMFVIRQTQRFVSQADLADQLTDLEFRLPDGEIVPTMTSISYFKQQLLDSLSLSRIIICSNCGLSECNHSFPKVTIWTAKLRPQLEAILTANPDVHDLVVRNRKVSLVVTTDGVSPLQNSRKDFWPVLFEIHDIPLHRRGKRKNFALAALITGIQHPSEAVWSVALKALINELRLLDSQDFFKIGEVPISVSVDHAIMDNIAIALVFHLTSHAALDQSCPYCLVYGTRVKGVESAVRWPLIDTAEPRNFDNLFDSSGRSGAKSITSSFSRVVRQDNLRIDFLHDVDHGTSKVLFSLLFDGKNREMFLGKQLSKKLITAYDRCGKRLENQNVNYFPDGKGLISSGHNGHEMRYIFLDIVGIAVMSSLSLPTTHSSLFRDRLIVVFLYWLLLRLMWNPSYDKDNNSELIASAIVELGKEAHRKMPQELRVLKAHKFFVHLPAMLKKWGNPVQYSAAAPEAIQRELKVTISPYATTDFSASIFKTFFLKQQIPYYLATLPKSKAFREWIDRSYLKKKSTPPDISSQLNVEELEVFKMISGNQSSRPIPISHGKIMGQNIPLFRSNKYVRYFTGGERGTLFPVFGIKNDDCIYVVGYPVETLCPFQNLRHTGVLQALLNKLLPKQKFVSVFIKKQMNVLVVPISDVESYQFEFTLDETIFLIDGTEINCRV